MLRHNAWWPLSAVLWATAYHPVHAQRPDESQAPPATETASPNDADEQRPEFAAWVGHAESANLTRTSDPERGSFENVGVLFAAAHDSARLTGRIDSNVEFRRYSLEGLDDETLGQLNGVADFNVAKDVFHWRFAEAYSQGPTDPFAPVGPGNRESINVFSSGPQLDLPLGRRTMLAIGGDYSRRRYQDSASVDSDSVLYDFSVLRQISETTEVGLIANANDIDYVDAAISPYEIDTLSLRYARTLATGRALIEWGENEVRSQGRSSDQPYFNLEWFRDVSARSTVSLGATREITDSGGMSATNLSDAPPAAESDVLLSTDPLERKTIHAAYLVATPRTNVSLRATASEDRYFGDTTLDNEGVTLSFGISRSVSTRLRFGLALDSVVREFTDTVTPREKDKDRIIAAWVDRALSRRFSVSLVLSRTEREGSGEFDEDRYEVRFSYSPTESASDALRLAGR